MKLLGSITQTCFGNPFFPFFFNNRTFHFKTLSLVVHDMTILNMCNLKTFRGSALIFSVKSEEGRLLTPKKDCKHWSILNLEIFECPLITPYLVVFSNYPDWLYFLTLISLILFVNGVTLCLAAGHLQLKF